ncbi:hypothetical protein E6L38_12580, partial [Bifidobacterium longum subsp. infantis]
FVSVASGHLTLLAVGQVLQRSLEPAFAEPSPWGGGGGIDGPGDGVDRPGVAFSESRDFSLNSEEKEARPSTYRERRSLVL